MADKVFLQHNVTNEIIEVAAAEFNNESKWGAAERECWTEVPSEEERNAAAWEQAVKDSKRHDAEVKKNDLAEEGLATADTPPRSASGNTTDTRTPAEAKGGK